jgi:phosphopantetheinyl transferase (holo-ACP synthase)
MGAITVRNLPPAVAKAVKEKARREGLSLNKAVVRLLEEATGQKPRATHDDLDHLAGRWSAKEYEVFMAALDEQRRIDPEMWK